MASNWSWLVVVAFVATVATSTTYAIDDVVVDGETAVDVELQDEDLDNSAIKARISDDGRLEWLLELPDQPRSETFGRRPHFLDRRHHHRHQHQGRRHGGRGPRGRGRHRGHGHMTGGRHRPCYGGGRGPCYGRWREAANMTTEQQLIGVCERLGAKFAAGAAPGLSRDEMISSFIDRKMRFLGVTDEEQRQTVTTMLRRRYDAMMTCCDEENSETKLECISRVRLAQFARVCSGEEPVCPWMLLRNQSRPVSAADDDDNNAQQQQLQQPSLTHTECCPLPDSEKLSCFMNKMAEYRRRWIERLEQQASVHTGEFRTIGRPHHMRGRPMRRRHRLHN